MINNLKAMKQLSIAIVDGVARGGGDEFVMACDLSYATENAAFLKHGGQTEREATDFKGLFADTAAELAG
jgi:1,4-dihydroxy-2-naphthoyl-CoA synthase